jgi:hypothetical protein
MAFSTLMLTVLLAVDCLFSSKGPIHVYCHFMQSADSRNNLFSSRLQAGKAKEDKRQRSLTTSSIPEGVSTVHPASRSTSNLDQPCCMDANMTQAPGSLNMGVSGELLPKALVQATLELRAAEAAQHQMPHSGKYDSQAQHNCRKPVGSRTDLTLVQVFTLDSWCMRASKVCVLSQ